MRERLVENILAHSKGKNWEIAKWERRVYEIYYSKVAMECLCWQKNIKNICVIQHKQTEKLCIIWNECIHHFLNKDYDYLFKDIKKLLKDGKQAVSEKTLNYIQSHGIADKGTCWMYGLYRRRKLEFSHPQMQIRTNVNSAFLNACYK